MRIYREAKVIHPITQVLLPDDGCFHVKKIILIEYEISIKTFWTQSAKE